MSMQVFACNSIFSGKNTVIEYGKSEIKNKKIGVGIKNILIFAALNRCIPFDFYAEQFLFQRTILKI